MITIAQLQALQPHHVTTTTKALRCLVAGVSPPIMYRNSAGVEKEVKTLGLADSTGATKASCYSNMQICQSGRAILLRNYLYKNNQVVLTSKTKVVQIPSIDVPQNHLQVARVMANPPAADLVAAKEMATSASVTIQGKITTSFATMAVQERKMVHAWICDHTFHMALQELCQDGHHLGCKSDHDLGPSLGKKIYSLYRRK